MALTGDGKVLDLGGSWVEPLQLIPGISNAVAISVGQKHGLALTEDGTVQAWGQLDGFPPPGLTNVVAISSGGYHALALRQDGTVVALGNAAYVRNLTNVVAIACGFDHFLTLREDGTVTVHVLVGGCYNCQLPPGLTNAVAIDASSRLLNLALTQNGNVIAWGYREGTNVPSGLRNVIAIAAGTLHGQALRGDGTVAVWGGDGFQGESAVPSGLTNVIAIDSGWDECIALTGYPDSSPVLAQPHWDGKVFRLLIPTKRGVSYRLEYKDSLADPHWRMRPPVPGNNSVKTIMDAHANAPQRFYRIRQFR